VALVATYIDVSIVGKQDEQTVTAASTVTIVAVGSRGSIFAIIHDVDFMPLSSDVSHLTSYAISCSVIGLSSRIKYLFTIYHATLEVFELLSMFSQPKKA